MNDTQETPPPLKGKVSAGVLAVVVVAAAFASDRWIPNSLLSLPLLIATLIAAIVTWWGVPKLRGNQQGEA